MEISNANSTGTKFRSRETTSDDTDRCLYLKMLHIKTGLSTKSRGSYNLSTDEQQHDIVIL
jgi:hypothetical protein